jgi:hypothetical protein
VLRPSSSTSGGQSEGVVGLVAAAIMLLLDLVEDFIIASQSAEDVHVRQL